MHTADPPDPPDAATSATGAALRRRVRGPMRSVYWRIFLWFWSAMLVLSSVVTATVYLTDPEQFFPSWRSIPLEQMDGLARRSIDAFERGGTGAVHTVLSPAALLPPDKQEALNSSIHAAYLFDAANGEELDGEKIPQDLRSFIARTRDTTDAQLQRLLSQLLIARSYTGGSSGRRYVFVVSMPRRSLLLPTRFRGAVPLSVAVVTSALVCYWLARAMVLPLRRLQTATQRLAGGDLTARVTPAPMLARRHDEFAELAADFDDMATRIEGLLTAQRRLIADISHEFGSPLTRVNVALGLAFRKAGEEVRPELERIQRESQRLNELIRHLLILSELESGTPAEPAEWIDLPALVGEVAADAEFEASSRRCRVHVTDRTAAPGSNRCKVRGVRHLLRSALENVVRNAVRYTAADSEVRIEINARSDAATGQVYALVSVRDQGPGVPPGAVEDLFRPFYRVSEARERQSGGAGLGLAITRQAVDAHGGKVTAANHPEGGLLVELELKL